MCRNICFTKTIVYVLYVAVHHLQSDEDALNFLHDCDTTQAIYQAAPAGQLDPVARVVNLDQNHHGDAPGSETSEREAGLL